MDGRKTKLTEKYIKILKEVVENALFCTDEELVFLVNQKLPKKDQVAFETFRAYKNGNRQADNPLIPQFVTLIKIALIKEKQALMGELRPGDNGWQAKAWIMERKFAEWNLRLYTENKNITDKFEIIIENKNNAEEIAETIKKIRDK